ncbi:hypothetical protein [Variovorax sp. Root411]|nr:hypothetical protein [Variovorax sp. Root411]
MRAKLPLKPTSQTISTEPNSLHREGFIRRAEKHPIPQAGREIRSPQTCL